MKLKIKIAKYILWLYESHIQEDWSVINKIGKIVLYPAWVIRSLLIWVTFPLWIPSYMFEQSATYQNFKKAGKALTMEQQMEMAKQAKIQRNAERNNFLMNKGGKTIKSFKKRK